MSSNKTGCKGNGSSAVGYWGRDIFRRINAEQEQARQRTLLTDQVLAGGIRSEMWKSVETGTKCSCYKESNKTSDSKCLSCHGIGLVPGYLKFGYNTLWMSAVDSDVTLTNVEITTTFKSSKIILSSSATTGTIESGDKTFSKTATGAVWENDVSSYVRVDGSSSVTVEYSLDSGVTWNGISNLTGATPSSGTIRFKATLSRDTTSILSPLFEMVRARYATVDLSSQQADGSYRMGPWVLLMRTIPVSRNTRSEWANLPTQENLKVWTVGLSEFDSSITAGSNDEFIRENNEVIFRIMDGVQTDSRYKITSYSPSDPFAYIITQQTFDIRYIDPVGPYNLIW